MENAVEALKTAASVLAFIIAITVSFIMFSKAKVTTDSIVKMQDRQAYLDSAEVDNGILYTSSNVVNESKEENSIESKISGMTVEGYRIVSFNDVISAIYRYSTEKYGVTIIKNNEAVARYDSYTESVIKSYTKQNEDIMSINDYFSYIKDNICDEKYVKNSQLKFDLKEMYKANVGKRYDAPWYGNSKEIRKRINCDINNQTYINGNIVCEKKNLKDILSDDKMIIEIVRNIDNNKYVKDEDNKDTSLVKTSEISTTEIVYIVQ